MVADTDPRPPPPDDAGPAWEAPPAPAAAASHMVDLEAEREVLGSVLIAPTLLATVREAITPACISSTLYARVYRAMCAIADDGGDPSDVRALLRQLGSDGQVSAARWMQAISELGDGVGHKANLPRYLAAVAAASQRRAIAEMAAFTEATAAAPMTPEEQAEWAEGLAERFRSLGRPRRKRVEFKGIREGISEALKYVERAATEEGFASGVEHGFADLAKLVPTLGKGHLVVLSGQPGSGKTSWACNVAERVAEAGGPVLIFSLEMLGQDLMLRMVAGRSRIALTPLREGKLGDDDWPRLVTASDDLSRLPIRYTDDGGLTCSEIVASLVEAFRAASVAGETPPALVVIDYLQQVQMKAARSRAEELDKTVHLLKAFAGTLDVPIVLMSSMNRNSKEVGAPKMSDLRGSGAIEFAADAVLMLWTPDKEDLSRRDMVVAKARHGSQGSVSLNFAGSYCRFSDRTVKWG